MNKKCIMIACAFFVAVALQAKVSLPAFFSDGMVMQQQSQASLWGKASKGKIVEVTTGWDGQTYTTRADEQGKWKLTVQTPAAGGPYDITSPAAARPRPPAPHPAAPWIPSEQSNMEMLVNAL